MKNHLSNRWKSNQLIGIDALTRKDGSAVILNFGSRQEDNTRHHFCVPFCDTTIASIEKYDDDMWSECQVFVESFDVNSNMFYVAGEGAMGNEGFIACLDQQKEPIWALFFCEF